MVSKYRRFKDLLRETPKFRKNILSSDRIRNELLESELKLHEEQVDLLRGQSSLLRQQIGMLERQNLLLENIRQVAMMPVKAQINSLIVEKQLSLADTVKAIRDEGLSFARFGDGEFRLMYRHEFDLKFQKNSSELMEALQDVVADPAPKLLLGMPHVFGNAHWAGVYAELWHELSRDLSSFKRFGNSHVSRPLYFSYLGRSGVDNWRTVWDGRDVTIVAGKGSRFELIPELFDNLGKVERIDSLPMHAFASVDSLVEEVLASKRDLVLVALGPTGTVLANRLARLGIQTIDIGHIAASYKNVFETALDPERQAFEIPTTS